jgi:hypothetical protein
MNKNEFDNLKWNVLNLIQDTKWKGRDNSSINHFPLSYLWNKHQANIQDLHDNVEMLFKELEGKVK